MNTNNICFYKVDACNLLTTKLLDYALIRVCAVIGSNTVLLLLLLSFLTNIMV